MSTAQRIAVLGLGRMGAPIAARLSAAGHSVVGYDPRAETGSSAVRAESAIAAVVHADIVLTVLPGSPELRTVMIDDSLLDDIEPSTVWIDCTSTAPDLARELSQESTARGVAHLDCALGGGPLDAADGALTLYVGGDRAVVDRCSSLLDALAAPGRIHVVGGEAGDGGLAKLLVNLVWFGQAGLVAETFLLGQASGLDAGRMSELLAHSPAASDFVSHYLPGLLTGDYVPSFGIDRVVEELDSLQRLAAEHGSPFTIGGAVAGIHRAALEHFGPADGELLGVAYLEHLAGHRLGDRTPGN